MLQGEIPYYDNKFTSNGNVLNIRMRRLPTIVKAGRWWGAKALVGSAGEWGEPNFIPRTCCVLSRYVRSTYVALVPAAPAPTDLSIERLQVAVKLGPRNVRLLSGTPLPP